MIERLFLLVGVAIVCYLFDCLLGWIFGFFYSRRCNYDCSKCRAWFCRSKYCSYKRKKTEDGVVDD